jgi:hypothetical protein
VFKNLHVLLLKDKTHAKEIVNYVVDMLGKVVGLVMV